MPSWVCISDSQSSCLNESTNFPLSGYNLQIPDSSQLRKILEKKAFKIDFSTQAHGNEGKLL